jgi:hypothetical protein
MKVTDIHSHNNLWDYTVSFDGHWDLLLYLGRSYFRSANLLKNQEFDKNYINTIIPSILCYTYAIEYLSCCILELEKIDYPKTNKVHNLKLLFEKFPLNIQSEVQHLFNNMDNGNSNLLRLLDENKLANNDWRYNFTPKKSELDFMNLYSRCLIKYIESRQKINQSN